MYNEQLLFSIQGDEPAARPLITMDEVLTCRFGRPFRSGSLGRELGFDVLHDHVEYPNRFAAFFR
jgi:hypothetical protein